MAQESGRNLHHYQVSNLLFNAEVPAAVPSGVEDGSKSPNKIMKLSKPMNSDDDDEEDYGEFSEVSGDEAAGKQGVVAVAEVPKQIFTMSLRQTTLTKKKAPMTPSKAPRSKSVGVPSLIITHSENRKDTLRSAVAKSVAKVERQSRSGAKTRARTKTAPSGALVAAEESGLKQQSLLDMLKQRKRRNVDLVPCQKRVGNSASNVQLQRLPNEIDIQI